MFKSGNTIINDALNSFKQITKQLDEGIKKSTEEFKATKVKLDKKQKEFAKLELELSTKALANTTDIAQAENVKQNLDKLLTGTL